MNEIIGQVEILNLRTGKPEDASLYNGISEKHINDFEKLWRPILLKKEKEIRSRHTNSGILDKITYLEELGVFGIQDCHWNWKEINEKIAGQLIFRAFAMECQEILQGLIVMNLGKVCQIPSQRNRPLIYVELIAVAPWNRPQLNKNQNYKYVGKVLIAAAMSLSIEEEFEGRIGLHSLSQAAGYYEKKVGMVNLGPDPRHQDLNYYETTPELTAIFLSS